MVPDNFICIVFVNFMLVVLQVKLAGALFTNWNVERNPRKTALDRPSYKVLKTANGASFPALVVRRIGM